MLALLTLPAASAVIIHMSFCSAPPDSPTPTTLLPTSTSTPTRTTTYATVTVPPTNAAPPVNGTTPLSWLPIPTLYECAEVRLRWAGGVPPFSVQVMAKSEPRVVLSNLTERTAGWFCDYRTGNWVGFAVAGRDGFWTLADHEEMVETGPGGCTPYDPPEPYDGAYAPHGEGVGFTEDESTDDAGEKDSDTDSDEGACVGAVNMTSRIEWPIARTSNSTRATYSVLDAVTTSLSPTSTPTSRTRPLGPIPLSTVVKHQSPTVTSTPPASATLGAVTAAADGTTSTTSVPRTAIAGLTAAVAGLLVLALVAWFLLRRLRRLPSDSDSEFRQKRVRRLPPPLDLDRSRPRSVLSLTSPRVLVVDTPSTVPNRTTVVPRETLASRSPLRVVSPSNPRAIPSKHRRQPSVPLSEPADEQFVRQYTPVTPFPLAFETAYSGPYPSSKPRVLVPTPYMGHRGDMPQRLVLHRRDTDDEDSIIASPSEHTPDLGGRRDASLIPCTGTPPPYEVACAWTPGGPQMGGTV